MATLKNVHTARLGVWDDADTKDEKHKLVRILPGRTVEVKRDFTNHPMVKAGMLVFEGGKAKSGRPRKEEAPEVPAKPEAPSE